MREPQQTSHHETHDLEIIGCPSCGAPAEIEWSVSVTSTNGALEHIKIRCVRQHWFLMPADAA